MKKIIALCLVLVLIFSLAACKKNSTDTESESNVTSIQTGTNAPEDSSSTETPDNSSDDETPSDVENQTGSTPSDDQVNLGGVENNTDTQQPETPSDVEDDEKEEEEDEEDSTAKDEVIDPGKLFCLHKYTQNGCTEPKVCVKCGRTVKPANPHKYTAGSCTEPKTCKVCGATKGTALGHNYKNATCTTPKTCSRCGDTQGKSLGHSYNVATCTVAKTCTRCGGTQGAALGHKYVRGECSVCKDYSDTYCPKLYFTGDMSKITDPKQTSKKIECDINFEYRSRDQVVDGAAKIKIQGTSSTQYAKKNYTINFYEDSTYGSKKKINVGWGAQSKYCLKANWIDKTHSRNVVTAKLAAQMQSKYGLFTVAPHNGTVDGFPVEVYINGEFHGLYTMNIPKDEWMFGMDKNNPNHIVICGENWNDPVKFKAIPQDLNDWAVEAGPDDAATLQKVQRLVDFVLNSSDAEFKANFSQYLDLDSTINYYIMMNCAWLPDNAGKNMLLATYDGKVWYPTLYDLDTSWGTHWRGDSLYNYSTGFVNGGDSVLWQRVRTLYKKEIAARYFELRKDVLSKENVLAEFNSFKTSIPQEVLDRETAKWNTAEHPIPGYDISQIENYIDTVFPRLDAEFTKWK